MATNIKIPKKLIEVALPPDDINAASAYNELTGAWHVIMTASLEAGHQGE